MRNRSGEEPVRTTAARTRDRRRGGRFVPFLVFALFGLFIVSREVPVVQDGIERVVAPERWLAARTCRDEALNQAKEPDYARIIERGEIHETRNGFFVEGIEVGEMGEQGGESRFLVDCYTDAGGALVRATRKAP